MCANSRKPAPVIGAVSLIAGWFSTTDWAREHPGLVQRFAAVMRRTSTWANDPVNRVASAAILVTARSFRRLRSSANARSRRRRDRTRTVRARDDGFVGALVYGYSQIDVAENCVYYDAPQYCPHSLARRMFHRCDRYALRTRLVDKRLSVARPYVCLAAVKILSSDADNSCTAQADWMMA
jgi:hypothetical protein